jgi:hypothetical protein
MNVVAWLDKETYLIYKELREKDGWNFSAEVRRMLKELVGK